MIKVNLIPSKKRKKQKPLSSFLIYTVLLTVFVGLVSAYVVYFFSSRLKDREITVRANEQKLAELKEKIKAVEDFEKKNADFKRRKEVIEQLSKNKTIPVKIIDEINTLLPDVVWLRSMDVKGDTITLACTTFTNSDVVNHVNKLKDSKMLTDVYLQESVLAKIGGNIDIYNFTLTMKVKK